VPACECLASLAKQVQAEKAFSEPRSADCEIHSRVLRASSAALSDGGGVVTVLRDITRERRIDQMKTEFISAVSHELRTPLTSVLGFARLISKVFDKDIVPLLPQEEAEEGHSARGQRAARRIHKNLDIIIIEAERLTRLINDVLDIAKLEAGDIEWHTREFALLPLIQQIMESAQVAAQAKGLTLATHLPSTLPVIKADPERITQVLENLLSNAIKFTDTGTITVTAQPFRFPLMPSDLEPDNPLRHLITQMAWKPPDDSVGGILISVADTGIGVTEVELPYLFQRFYQVRSDTLIDKPKGTGLGLAISKGILMYYGGTIWANSIPGIGSTFSFVLPLSTLPPGMEAGEPPITETWSASSSAMPTKPVEAPTQGQGDLVLIVDDEPAIRTLLAQTLGDHGYRILEVANGVAGLRAARRQRPSVIILDLMLPDISGFDVAQLLKADPSTASIPIVILSILENRERAAELGIETYLTKPVQSAVLLQTLAEVLESAKARSTGGF
jgi:signal transduction histidine kinase/CheY-like chemotaxis protein